MRCLCADNGICRRRNCCAYGVRMTHYKPCQNCAADKAACPVRTSVREAIAGANVTSINFKCNQRQQMFHHGQRVNFYWRVFEDHDEGYDEARCVFAGTVLEENGLRFIVRVDEGSALSIDGEDDGYPDARDVFRNDRLVIKVRPADMWASGEHDRTMCPDCLAYPDEPDRCQGWGKPGSWDCYWPDGCLHKETKVKL